MSLLTQLIGFGLRQVIGDSADDAAQIVGVVEQRFRDHSRTLPKALESAHQRAWQALGVALAGDGLLDRLKVFFASGDDKGVREQVQVFLKDNAVSFDGTPAAFRQTCLDELKRLRKSGQLATSGGSAADIARQAAGFKRHTDPQGLIEESRRAVAGVADALADGYPNLSRLLRTPTPAGPPLLAAAFCYFFRREVETDDELAHGLFFDGLRQLSASQAKAFGEVGKALTALGGQFDALFEQLGRIEAAVVETRAVAVETHGAVLDMQAELERLGGLHLANVGEVRSLVEQVLTRLTQAGMARGEVRPGNSCSIRGEDERRAVKALLARFRRLPAEEQRQAPALLNGLGKLQVGAGDFAEARQTFTEVVQVVGDPSDKAEASFNAYRAALEEKKWDAALAALREAGSHDPQRFAPFPLHRYEPKRILGAGGFGTAILCLDRHFDEDVVVKTLHAADLARGVEEVFREARILRRLSHPAIIGVRDCEYADPASKARPYLVMDYFPGGTLQQFVEQRGPLNLEQLLAVAVPVAEGMRAAHAQGVLHRDLKPANLLVRKEGNLWKAKIIDFGLALRQQTVETSKVRAGATQKSIQDWSVAGTLDYAPPEQLGKLPGTQPGPYSDAYAFARTCCYAMFKATELRRKQWDSLPGPLADLLEGCLDPDPRQRPKGFEPVLAVLGECSREGQETRRREQEERLRREQEEEQRRQRDGEEQLGQLVRAALDRTGGKPSADDPAKAKDLCRRYKLSADRANAVVREVRDAWHQRREEQEREQERQEAARRAGPTPAPAPAAYAHAAFDIERPDCFYLGREYDLTAKAVRPDKFVMYDASDLTTHGVVVGMTGCSKTGLCISILEEAGIDGIPCVIIDTKGDLTNLALQFPDLDPRHYEEWLDEDDARRKGLSREKYAQQLSGLWRKGLEDSYQKPDRIAHLKASSDQRIYTPGGEAGLPLSILGAFAAPRTKMPREELTQRIAAAATALLSLTKVAADSVQSREHILISHLVLNAWTAGRDLDLPKLIREIEKPPISSVGAYSLETFFPAKDRVKFASALNNVLASPTLSTWTMGEPLDLESMLYRRGRPQQLIFYVAHLDDTQRMFFTTLLLEETLAWTQRQPRTTNLRALLYIDDAFGYLPPHPANPPSKGPLLTLLKQAGAFGVGVLLAAQNPADLDYKALSNVGTWFVGKLQSDRDKARLLEGMESAAAGLASLTDRATLDSIISALGSRIFLWHDIHRRAPIVFQSRWALSFLRGPMTREQVGRLMEPLKHQCEAPPAVIPMCAACGSDLGPDVTDRCPKCGKFPWVVPQTRLQDKAFRQGLTRAAVAPAGPAKAEPANDHMPPVLPGDVKQFHLPAVEARPRDAELMMHPLLLGVGSVVYVLDKHAGTEHTEAVRLLAQPPAVGHPAAWETAWPLAGAVPEGAQPPPDARWTGVPESLDTGAKLKALEKAFGDHLWTRRRLSLWENLTLGLLSWPGESEVDFRKRCKAAAEEQKKQAVEMEKVKFRPKFESLGLSLPDEKPRRSLSLWDADDPKVEEKRRKLTMDYQSKVAEIAEKWKRVGEEATAIQVKPRKADVHVTHFGLAWAPYWRTTGPDGQTQLAPAYR